MFADIGPKDDYSYTGENPAEASPVSLDYYREVARNFQSTLNQLDVGLRAAYTAEAAHVSPAFDAEMRQVIDQIEAKRGELKTVANAINAGAAIINAAGGRFPVLSVPSGLGLLPAIPVAAIAAIGAAVALIAWGSQLVAGLNERLAYAQRIENLSPDQRAAVAVASSQASQASSALSIFNGLGGVGNVVKWGALGFVAWIVWRDFLRPSARR